MSKHSAAPWSLLTPNSPFICSTSYIVARCCSSDEDHFRCPSRKRAISNAEHVVACVNGCAGINPTSVPKCLAALETLLAYASAAEYGTDEWGEDSEGVVADFAAARATLARARKSD